MGTQTEIESGAKADGTGSGRKSSSTFRSVAVVFFVVAIAFGVVAVVLNVQAYDVGNDYDAYLDELEYSYSEDTGIEVEGGDEETTEAALEAESESCRLASYASLGISAMCIFLAVGACFLVLSESRKEKGR